MVCPLPDYSHQLIPNLCRLPVVFGVLVLTQLLLIIYVLSLGTVAAFNWELLALLTLYVQWVSLLSLLGLCCLRSFINHLSSPVAVLVSLAWILAVVGLANGLAQWVYAARIVPAWSGQWLLKDLLIALVIGSVALRYLYMRQQWLFEQRATHSARLDALQARIRPHFLFNSMNTIASLIRYAPAEAEAAVEDLAALLRASLSDRRQFVEWRQELAICKAYARIEQQRLGERLQLDWQLAAVPDDLLLPPLVLQPLLENAIGHGIERRAEGGTVSVSAVQDAARISFSIENPLAECPSDAVPTNHNGLALDNVSARLASLYSDPQTGEPQASLTLGQCDDKFVATLTVPLDFKPETGEQSYV